MKIKCISTTREGGFLRKREEQIEGITSGKVYEASAIPIVTNFANSTSIDLGDIKFLIYNDCNRWEVYDKRLFIPIS